MKWRCRSPYRRRKSSGMAIEPKAPPLKSVTDEAPKFKIITQGGRTGVVLDREGDDPTEFTRVATRQACEP